MIESSIMECRATQEQLPEIEADSKLITQN